MEMHERIKETREKAGLSQSDVARALDVTPQSVQQWEVPKSNGGTSPRSQRLKSLAEVLGVDYGWLATGQRSVSDFVTPNAVNQDKFLLDKWVKLPSQAQKHVMALIDSILASPSSRHIYGGDSAAQQRFNRVIEKEQLRFRAGATKEDVELIDQILDYTIEAQEEIGVKITDEEIGLFVGEIFNLWKSRKKTSITLDNVVDILSYRLEKEKYNAGRTGSATGSAETANKGTHKKQGKIRSNSKP